MFTSLERAGTVRMRTVRSSPKQLQIAALKQQHLDLSMEESEKRRERLRAMRMEAAKSDVNTDSGSSGMVSHSLSNPLIEGEAAPSTAVQHSHARFDYYTDPLSAFSADKRRNNSRQVSQGYSSVAPNMTSSPIQRPTQSRGAHYSHSSFLRTPVGAASPLGRPQGNTSSTWGGSHSDLTYSHSPNMPDVNFPNSGVVRGDSPYASHGWGRGGRYSNSPHPQLHSHDSSRHGSGHYSDLGRGRGRSLGGNSSKGLGPSGRRGKDYHDPVSAELRPHLYYDKEMLEDPWKGLTPVIWKAPKSDRSWVPESISVKKAKPSPEASHKSISQTSLAEYLATSFDDTVNEPDT